MCGPVYSAADLAGFCVKFMGKSLYYVSISLKTGIEIGKPDIVLCTSESHLTVTVDIHNCAKNYLKLPYVSRLLPLRQWIESTVNCARDITFKSKLKF